MTEAWLASELAGLSRRAARRSACRPTRGASATSSSTWRSPSRSTGSSWKTRWPGRCRPPPTRAQATDAGILWYGIDRGNRQRTGEARVPDGRFKTAAEAHAAFVKLRATMTARAKTSADDFRGRPLIDGNMDVYQWFLMISTHSQRHILQIREVKAHPRYPKR